MILFLLLSGVQVSLLLLAVRWLHRRMVRPGGMAPGVGRNLLVSVVRALPAQSRRALYAAANSGHLRRGTWNGCALNRAGEMLGMPVRSRGQAAVALGTTGEVIGRFLHVWDGLSGSNRNCTAMLRDALQQAGLLDEDGVDLEAHPGRVDPPPGSRSASPRHPGCLRGAGPRIKSRCGRPRRWRCQRPTVRRGRAHRLFTSSRPHP
jgi:hypothetical protein